MGFTVPNGPDAPVVDQTEPDALDYEALGFRGTGVVSGCGVTAQLTPDMSVSVAAGKVVVDGVPIDVSSGSVTIQTADANPRFDLIVVNSSGVRSAIRGTASATNPLFPDCDLATYALLASIYVGAATTSIATSAIVDKRIMLATSLQRSYTNSTDPVLSAEGPDGVFSVTAGGKVSWIDAILERIGVGAMELTSTLRIKASDAATSVLTLRSRTTSPENQKVLDVQAAGGTTVASVSGTGVIEAANFLRGDGPPEGVVTADKASLYIDRTGERNASLWIKEGDSGTNTGWYPFRVFDPTDDAIPVGTIAPFIGPEGAVPPGWLAIVGQPISVSDPGTSELANIVSTLYGSAPGFVYLPNFRGRIPIGAGGDVALTIGQVTGSVEVTLTEENMPVHGHDVVDPGHGHPTAGRGVYTLPSGPLHPSTEQNNTFAVFADPVDLDTTSDTGISVQNAGSGTPFSAMPPVAAVTWMVKARSAGVQANAEGTDGLWSVADLDARYMVHVGPMPPTTPVLGHTWLMTPDDHAAMFGSGGWIPLSPPTDNAAVIAGNALLEAAGLWLAGDGS